MTDEAITTAEVAAYAAGIRRTDPTATWHDIAWVCGQAFGRTFHPDSLADAATTWARRNVRG